MDTKFLSLTGLTEYDEKIKSYIDSGLGGKSATSHTHDDRYYTETEIDAKISTINENVDKITSGDTVVSKATSADTATYATNAGTANSATSADKAITATNAGTATYAKSAGTASKLGTATVGSSTKPIYLKAGVATTCTEYAGGTRITLNGTSKSGSSAAIFAPTTGGTSGYILKSAGTGTAPVWAELDAYTKSEVDTKLSGKSDTSHNHDAKYDAKGASTAALADAKTYADGKVKGMATTAVVDSKISTHNSSTASHSDIRATLASVKEDVDAFFKDATISTEAKDTLKEIQEYITSDATAAAEMASSIANKADKATYEAHAASTVSHITAEERTKWNSAQANQNAFSNVKVGSTTVAADTTTDTIEFVGSNVTITPDATNDKITFTVANGSTSAKGVVKLENSVASTATTTAATPNSVKQAYDLATTAKNAASAAQATADGKADADHDHAIDDVTGLQDALDGKAASSHGTHVTWSTTSPKMNGTASVGSETKVARGDHIHPTDTSRAAKTDFDTHVASTVSHITAAERTKWDAKASTASATTASAGLMTSAMVTKLNGIAEGANKYTLPTATTATFGGVKSGSTVTSTSGLTAAPIISGIPYYKDTNTTYKAGTGIALSGTTFSNAGVRSVVTGSTNGTIIVNTNGTTASVPVKGLGAAAYLAMDSSLSTSSTNPVQNKAVANAINTLSSAVNANTDSISTHTSVISDLQTAVNEIQEITSAEIQQLFQS